MQQVKNKTIGIGSIVTVYDAELEEKIAYKIVSAKTGEKNELSYDCALGKALLGRSVGQKVLVEAEEKYVVDILDVDNSNIKEEKFYRNTFFCFQGRQFFHECTNGYIFAGLDKSISHWNRLRSVKEGDIIFHGTMRGIVAISVAEGSSFISPRPSVHYSANTRREKEGLMVNTKYKMIDRPIITFKYTEEIKELQGDHEGKGYPFNKNGKGNEGYLFNLNRRLAKFFMEEIIKCNPDLAEEDYVKDLLQ